MNTDDPSTSAGRPATADQAPPLGPPDDLAELNLRRELAEARADALAKSDMLAHVSHEIRTPMNGILGMIELTLRTPLADGQREALEIARSSAESLLAILDEALDLSRLDAGKLRIEPVEFDPGQLVEQAARLLAPGAHAKGLRLGCMIRPSAPARVLGDAQRIRQILLNLLGNAIKFTPRGRVEVELAAEATDDPATTRLRLAVSDTGVGIPASRLEAVFGPFEQADPSTPRHFGGTGLGLAISDRLARLLGGEIRLESRPGWGSTFTVDLPVGAADSALSPRPGRPLGGLRVGLVVTEPIHREALAELIERAGGSPVLSIAGWNDTTGAGLDCLVTDAWPLVGPPAPGASAAPVIVLEPFGCAGNLREAILLPQLDPVNPDRLVQPPPTPSLAGSLDHDPPEIAGLLSLDGFGFEQAREPAGRIATPIVRADALAALARATHPGGSAPGARSAEPGAGPSRRLRVLLAEDNPVSRIVGRRMLEEFGHEVRLAEDGLRAVELADDESFDLAILDVQMPGLDGLSALRQIRELEARAGRRRLPVAALTAHARPEDRARHLRDGFDAFLTKPLRPADLRETLARLVPPLPDPPSRSWVPVQEHGVLGRELLLLCGGDRLFLRDLVAIFLDSAPRSLGRLRDAFARGDPRAIASEAHSLRGVCLTVGASGLAAIARDLEVLSSTGPAEALSDLLAEAGDSWSALRAELLDILVDAGLP